MLNGCADEMFPRYCAIANLAAALTSSLYEVRKPIVLNGNGEHALLEFGSMHGVCLCTNLFGSRAPALWILKVIVFFRQGSPTSLALIVLASRTSQRVLPTL
jgi:hypothetical protein